MYISDEVFHICPADTPFVLICRHNKRQLGKPRGGMRVRRARVAKARFQVAPRIEAAFHEWHNDRLLPI